jgi:hypothetical protein
MSCLTGTSISIPRRHNSLPGNNSRGSGRRVTPYCFTIPAAGDPIGSGVAEGACRHLVKDRMEQSGMRSTLEGAQAMLHVRALYLIDQWDDFLEYRID